MLLTLLLLFGCPPENTMADIDYQEAKAKEIVWVDVNSPMEGYTCKLNRKKSISGHRGFQSIVCFPQITREEMYCTADPWSPRCRGVKTYPNLLRE